MKEKSILRRKIGEDKYISLKEKYPLIEGYLLKKLDNVLLLSELSPDIDTVFNKWNWYGDIIVRISKVSSFEIELILNHSHRRIGLNIKDKGEIKLNKNCLCVRVNNGEKHRDTFSTLIYKKINIMTNSNSRDKYDYTFRFNYRNCQRIVDIIELLISHEKETI